MTDEEKILAHTQLHYPNECLMIERSMINYYHSRFNTHKTEQEIFHQQMIYNGVIDLFEILSLRLEAELGINSDDIFIHLKNIHIKT